MASGYLYVLAVCAHALSDLELTGVALAHTRAHSAKGSGRVVGVGPTILCTRGSIQAVVGAHLVLVLGGYLPIVVEGWAVFDCALWLRDLDGALLVVYSGDV